MNNVGEKFLPIGTVVMLKGGSKRVMITGFCSMAAEDGSEMYDYAGCMYPEGFLSSDQTALFNHDQIDRIYHMGLVDEEEKTFKTSLNTLVSQMNGGGAPTTSVAPVSPVSPVEEQPVPPVGPGLPGYVAPVVAQPVAPVAPVTSNGFQFDANGNVVAAPQSAMVQPIASTAPVTSNGFQFDANGNVVAAPQQAPVQPNYKFDENGVIVSVE